MKKFSVFLLLTLLVNFVSPGMVLALNTPTPIPNSSDHQSADSHFRDAAILHYEGSFDEAITEYIHAIQLDPDLDMAYRGLASAYTEQGDPESAISFFQGLLNQNPQNGLASYGIGRVYELQKLTEKARAAYQKAVEINPNTALAYNALSLLYWNQDDKDLALKTIRFAIKNKHLSHPFMTNNLIIYLKDGRSNDEIIADYRSRLEANPDDGHADEYQYMVAFGYFSKGFNDQAIQGFQKVIDNYPESPFFTTSQKNIGHAWFSLGEYDKAIQAYTLGIENHPSSSEIGQLHLGLAASLMSSRRFTQALKEYELVLDQYPDQAVAFSGSGEDLIFIKDDIQLLRDGGGEGIALMFEANKAFREADCYTAFAKAQEGLEIADKIPPNPSLNKLGFYETMFNCASIYGGDPENTLKIAADYVAEAQSMGNRCAEADGYDALAVGYTELGKYQDAFTNLTKASDVISQEECDPGIEVGIYFDLAKWYSQWTGSQKAMEYYQKVLDLLETGEGYFHHEETYFEVLTNMALEYRRQGEVDRAEKMYQSALDFAIGIKRPDLTAHLYEALASIYQEAGESKKALDYYNKAMENAQKHKIVSREVNIHIDLGNFFDEKGDFERAKEEYLAAIEKGQDKIDPGNQILAYQGLGLVSYRGEKNIPEALNAFKNAVDLIEKHKAFLTASSLKSNYSSIYSGVYDTVIDLLFASAKRTVDENLGDPHPLYEEAFLYAERNRARAFLDSLGNVDIKLGTEKKIEEMDREKELRDQITLLQQAILKQQSQPLTPQLEELLLQNIDELAAKQSQYEDLVTNIQVKDPTIASLISIDPIEVKRLQTMLDKNTTLISYYMTGNKPIIFVIAKNNFNAVELDITRDEIDRAIENFRGLGIADLSNPNLQQLRQFYDWLIAPIQQYLTTVSLGVIPHDVLHYLPFAAIYDGKNYLGELYTIFELPSATSYKFVAERRYQIPQTVLAFGYNQPIGFPVLRYAEEEANEVAKIYGERAFVGKDATKETFKTLSSNAHAILLSAHAELNETTPLLSQIWLAASSDHNQDSALTVGEVYGLNLNETSVVVLSACDTGRGRLLPGDELIGLNRAFMVAGAKSIVSSLWKVDDLATKLLITQFFIYLKQDYGPAQALQKAQSDVRIQYPHPYYWAGFVLTGYPGDFESIQVPASKIQLPTAIILIIGLLIVIAGLLAIARIQKGKNSSSQPVN